jgi:putative transposase
MTTSSYESLSHSKWNCKYHLVFVPKYRKKVLYGKIREFLARTFHELANQKGCKIEKGNMVQDHVHMLISIPPKLAVSDVIGYIKGKSAIAVARQFGGKERNFNGEKFWARGYAVSTVGFEEGQIRSYIKNQEQLDTLGYDEKGEF